MFNIPLIVVHGLDLLKVLGFVEGDFLLGTMVNHHLNHRLGQ